MGCGGSKESAAAVEVPPKEVSMSAEDKERLANNLKQMENNEESRLQNQAATKSAAAEKQANEAAADGIAHKLSATLADNQIEKSRELHEGEKAEQSKNAVESFKGQGAKLRFREAMKEGRVADAHDSCALMVQSAWRAHLARRSAAAKKAEKKRLLEDGVARKIQSLYRCRMARKRVAAKREEKKKIIRNEADRRATKEKAAMKLDDVKVSVPPEMMKGIIQKQGQIVKSVKPRYFVLRIVDNDSRLTYYAKDLPTEPFGADEKGFIFLKGAILVEQPGNDYMVTDSQGRDLKLLFMSAADKTKWVAALKAHVSYVNKK